MLSIANNRAVRTVESPVCRASTCAMWFRCPGGLYVPSTSFAQNHAVCVCSAERLVLFLAPYAFTSS